MPDLWGGVAAWETFWDRLVTWVIGDGLRVLLTLVLALVVRWLAHRAINRVVGLMTSKSVEKVGSSGRAGRVLAQAAGLAHQRHVQWVNTLGSLLRSVVTFVVTLIAVLTVMALVGLPLGPLLASAGVGGVALGFGAQSLVKDFLSGVFIIMEDQYGVGDVIDTGEAIGTVEECRPAGTRLRDANGVVWYIRNGESSGSGIASRAGRPRPSTSRCRMPRTPSASSPSSRVSSPISTPIRPGPTSCSRSPRSSASSRSPVRR